MTMKSTKNEAQLDNSGIELVGAGCSPWSML